VRWWQNHTLISLPGKLPALSQVLGDATQRAGSGKKTIVYLPIALDLALNPCISVGRAVGLTRRWQIMWFGADDCGLVALNLVSVAPNVVSRPPIESLNLVEKSAMIAVRPSDDCSSLHVGQGATRQSSQTRECRGDPVHSRARERRAILGYIDLMRATPCYAGRG
jgi:hypothetical protein